MLSLLYKHKNINLTWTGATGTGRTTFVNTLCDSNVLSKKICDNPEDAHHEPGINIKPVSIGKFH
jgi:septin family protein